MAESFDIAIVGAGITGCAIARQLARYENSICVIEAGNDVALGASKANGGLVHAGYDPAPGTVKAQVNARGCELYSQWSSELASSLTAPAPWSLVFPPMTTPCSSASCKTVAPTASPSSRSWAPSAFTILSRALTSRQRAPSGARQPDTSIHSTSQSHARKTPRQTA